MKAEKAKILAGQLEMFSRKLPGYFLHQIILNNKGRKQFNWRIFPWRFIRYIMEIRKKVIDDIIRAGQLLPIYRSTGPNHFLGDGYYCGERHG